MNKKLFAIRAVDVACFAGIVGFALKFLTYIDNWVFLPRMPNNIDFIFLVLAAFWLFYGSKEMKKHEKN